MLNPQSWNMMKCDTCMAPAHMYNKQIRPQQLSSLSNAGCNLLVLSQRCLMQWYPIPWYPRLSCQCTALLFRWRWAFDGVSCATTGSIAANHWGDLALLVCMCTCRPGNFFTDTTYNHSCRMCADTHASTHARHQPSLLASYA